MQKCQKSIALNLCKIFIFDFYNKHIQKYIPKTISTALLKRESLIIIYLKLTFFVLNVEKKVF